MCRTRSRAHAVAMFPFTSYEAARMLVDEHVDDMRRSAVGRPERPTRRPRAWRGESRRRSAR
jgi:hypothetical protein